MSDFDQVPMPRHAPTAHNPALVLDWYRFCSDTIIAFARMQAQVLREGYELEKLDGTMVVSFHLTEDQQKQNLNLSILYWDPIANGGVGGWVELPPYAARPDGPPLVRRLHPSASPDDGMHILGGVRVFGDTATVKVNFAGTFVLVVR